ISLADGPFAAPPCAVLSCFRHGPQTAKAIAAAAPPAASVYHRPRREGGAGAIALPSAAAMAAAGREGGAGGLGIPLRQTSSKATGILSSTVRGGGGIRYLICSRTSVAVPADEKGSFRVRNW